MRDSAGGRQEGREMFRACIRESILQLDDIDDNGPGPGPRRTRTVVEGHRRGRARGFSLCLCFCTGVDFLSRAYLVIITNTFSFIT